MDVQVLDDLLHLFSNNSDNINICKVRAEQYLRWDNAIWVQPRLREKKNLSWSMHTPDEDSSLWEEKWKNRKKKKKKEKKQWKKNNKEIRDFQRIQMALKNQANKSWRDNWKNK